MIFPFEALDLAQRELGLVVALLLGFAFGFVLERAGFGNARKLAAQFYLSDMTVLKVMFSAIVTAMGGMLVAAGLGLADLPALSRSIASWTWLWPMLAGGFVLGVGFLMSGYCPGTSIVSAASGNADGLVAFAGVVVGSFLYNLLLAIPAVSAFHESGELGPAFLHELLGVPAPVVGVAVALMAIGAFVGAEKVEAIMRRRAGVDASEWRDEVRPRRLAFATFGALAIISLVLLALPHRIDAGSPVTASPISAETLARRIVEDPWTVRVIDLRPAAQFAAGAIPASENVDATRSEQLGLDYADSSRDIVLVAEEPVYEIPPGIAAFRGRALVLDGGWPAWKRFALDTPETPEPDAGVAERELYAFRSALNAALAKRAMAPAPPAPAKGYVPKPKKGGGCNA